MSRWEGWRREYEEGRQEELNGPADIQKILEDGKMELLGAYCLGDEECAGYAWSIFADALEKASDPHAALLWIGKTYADLGFFADAAEALGELCSRFKDPDARRLLAEVIWWRDNAHRIPWIPPRGDGSRYDRMMKSIDPAAPITKEQIHRVRTENQKERIAPYRPSIDPGLASLFSNSIPDPEDQPSSSPVDWSFLDEDNGQPGEPADRVKKLADMLEDDSEVVEDLLTRHRWTRSIKPPSTPPRYDPNEPPFSPPDFLEDDDS
jgi:hypothetical protein